MGAPRHPRGLLRSLASRDWAVVRDALEQAGEWLRSRAGTEAEVAAVAAQMVKLTRHPKWEVRRAVALAALYLRHQSFLAATVPLLSDDHGWVREAAERTQVRRTEMTRADVLRDQHGELLMEWLTALEETHGTAARKASLRVAEKYAELMMREAYHEIVKVVAPIELATKRIRAGLTEKRLDRQKLSEDLERVERRVRLVTAIINGLREFTTEVVPEFRTEELRGLVEESAALIRDRMRASKEAFVVENAIDSAVHLEAHRHRLLQAFTNVVQNAYEAHEGMPGPRHLRVEARVDQGLRVVVAFMDRGCGMEPERLSDSFRLYSTSKPQGTGFGLPLAKKIIETEHGGTLSLSSELGQGTTVTVVLPLEQGERELGLPSTRVVT